MDTPAALISSSGCGKNIGNPFFLDSNGDQFISRCRHNTHELHGLFKTLSQTTMVGIYAIHFDLKVNVEDFF